MERIKRHIGIHHISSWKIFLIFLAIVLGGVLGIAYSINAYPDVFRTEVYLEKNQNISFTEPVVVNFSQSVMAKNYTENVKVSSGQDIQVTWEDSNRKMVITPSTFWKPDASYDVILPEGKSMMFININSQKFSFSTITSPKVTNFFPKDGDRNVLIDIEDPIVVDFNKSTNGFFLKFTISPFSDMAYQNNPQKTQFKLLPSEALKEGAKYQVKIYSKYVKDSDDAYREIFSSSFETAPPAKISWEKDLSLRLEQARKYTQPKVTSGKYIDINLESQVLTTFENGKLLDSYMISSGKRGMETPKGEKKIYNKARRAYSKAYGLYMPYWMAIESDGSRGIHELPEWPGGYKEGAAHLGIPVSHGCVRLGVGPAQTVYDWVDIGTPVVIY